MDMSHPKTMPLGKNKSPSPMAMDISIIWKVKIWLGQAVLPLRQQFVKEA